MKLEASLIIISDIEVKESDCRKKKLLEHNKL